MNDLSKTKPSNEEALQLGLSPLHCRIKCMEYILHIAYNLSFECWWTSKKNEYKKDFDKRFQDVLKLNIPDWIINPFENTDTIELELQEEIIELSANEQLKLQFKNGYKNFWLHKEIATLYPAIWDEAKKFFIAFPSSYLVERGFSAVTNLITKNRNRLSVVERGDLRLMMTNIDPNSVAQDSRFSRVLSWSCLESKTRPRQDCYTQDQDQDKIKNVKTKTRQD